MDAGNDLSQTGEATDRWDFFGNPRDFKSGAIGTNYLAGADAVNDPLCVTHARSLDSLSSAGCYKVPQLCDDSPRAGNLRPDGPQTPSGIPALRTGIFVG